MSAFSLGSGLALYIGIMKQFLTHISLGLGLVILASLPQSVRAQSFETALGHKALLVSEAPRLVLIGDRHRERFAEEMDRREQRNQDIDRAIRMALRRSGGVYVSAEAIDEDTYRVVVRIGPRIVVYRVNVRSDQVDEE